MFEPLDKHHNCTAFDCGQDGINRYLQTMASQHHKKGVARVHVLADDSVIKAFYTLSNAHFDNTAIKSYPKQIPIVIIGRIGVSKNYQGQGLSKHAIKNALERIKSVSTQSGVVFAMIDAKDEQLAQYYEQFGFVPTANPLRLILNVRQI